MKKNPKFRFLLLFIGLFLTLNGIVLDVLTQGNFWLVMSIIITLLGSTCIMGYWVLRLEWRNTLVNIQEGNDSEEISGRIFTTRDLMAYALLGFSIPCTWIAEGLALYVMHTKGPDLLSIFWFVILLGFGSYGMFINLRYDKNFDKILIPY